MPEKQSTNDVVGHVLTEFANDIFDLVMKLDGELTKATGDKLADLRKSAQDFETSAGKILANTYIGRMKRAGKPAH